jgi:hypothetical protein
VTLLVRWHVSAYSATRWTNMSFASSSTGMGLKHEAGHGEHVCFEAEHA